MDLKVGILILLVIATSRPGDATSSVSRSDTSAQNKKNEIITVDEAKVSDEVCTICEQSVAQAVQYLSGNNTQQQLIDILYSPCSRLKTFADECYKVVDHYAPMVFSELSLIQPEDVCRKFNLCEIMEQEGESIVSGLNTCQFCQDKIHDVLNMLKDQDIQSAYIETLGFVCKLAMPSYLEKCEPMAFEYVPLVFADLQNYLETMNTLDCSPKETTVYKKDKVAALELEGELLVSESQAAQHQMQTGNLSGYLSSSHDGG